MLIQQEEKDNQGCFFIEEDGIQLAEMDYSLSPPNTMVILHTEVDEVLKGRKIGDQLINHAVQYALVKNYKIIPLCPFVKGVFEKRPEAFKDVVKEKEAK
ncbi:GNAT family N-acetyltransferase [soil metagenome]